MTEENKNNDDKKQRKATPHGVDQIVRDAIDRVLADNQTEATPKANPNRRRRKTAAAAAPDAEPAAQGQAPHEKDSENIDTAPTAALAEEESKKTSRRSSGRKKPAAATPVEEKPAQQPPKRRRVRQAQAKPAVAAPDEASVSPVANSKKEGSKKGDRDYKLKIIPLGGLGEVGKNMMLVQYGNDIIVVDCGVSFPEDGMYGVDLVIPDYTYLQENRSKLRAYIVTHGHEDHIGAMPYVLRDCPAPVYGAPLTLGMLKNKLNEHRINADLRAVAPREEIEVGPFRIEFIRVTHSIPDSMGVAIHTPVGTIMIISDFKMDMSPVDGKLMDFGRISALGEKGVLLLMSDSTNVEKAGFTDSERTVGAAFDKIFLNVSGRIIVTSFASHVHRVQQIIWAAHRVGRKVAITGRGMLNMVSVAMTMGYLEVPDKCLIDVDDINNFPANRVVIVTTGSQGESMSGLTRIATGEHRQVQIIPGDTVVISAHPIPGNERMVSRVVDNLFRLGANVIYERQQHIHVSGHASQEEQKVLINMVRPRFFLPIHGEYRMLQKHAQLAQQIGMSAENTIVMENGHMLELGRRSYRLENQVPSGRILIDGLGVGDVGATVLRERRQLSEGGVVIVSLVYTKGRGKLPKVLVGPDISTRGFIFEKEYEHIIGEMKKSVEVLITPEHLADGSLNDLRNQVRAAIGRYALDRFGRRPVVLTVISQV